MGRSEVEATNACRMRRRRGEIVFFLLADAVWEVVPGRLAGVPDFVALWVAGFVPACADDVLDVEAGWLPVAGC